MRYLQLFIAIFRGSVYLSFNSPSALHVMDTDSPCLAWMIPGGRRVITGTPGPVKSYLVVKNNPTIYII